MGGFGLVLGDFAIGLGWMQPGLWGFGWDYLIMVDEPTEGLSPQMTEKVGTLLEEIARRGVSIMLVEQKLSIALKISQRVYVMGHGQVVFEGTPAELGERDDVRKEWLEV